MTQESTCKKSESNSTFFYRLFYGGFLLLAAYFLISGDYWTALSNAGLALIFDPFEKAGSWPQRSKFQKGWLIGHLFLLFAGLMYLLFV